MNRSWTWCVYVPSLRFFGTLLYIFVLVVKLTVTQRVQKKVTMDYGFPSLDEELAKDHLDGENAWVTYKWYYVVVELVLPSIWIPPQGVLIVRTADHIRLKREYWVQTEKWLVLWYFVKQFHALITSPYLTLIQPFYYCMHSFSYFRFSGGSGALDNSSNGQDGVLQNVNPSVILDINPQQSGNIWMWTVNFVYLMFTQVTFYRSRKYMCIRIRNKQFLRWNYLTTK